MHMPVSSIYRSRSIQWGPNPELGVSWVAIKIRKVTLCLLSNQFHPLPAAAGNQERGFASVSIKNYLMGQCQEKSRHFIIWNVAVWKMVQIHATDLRSGGQSSLCNILSRFERGTTITDKKIRKFRNPKSHPPAHYGPNKQWGQARVFDLDLGFVIQPELGAKYVWTRPSLHTTPHAPCALYLTLYL